MESSIISYEALPDLRIFFCFESEMREYNLEILLAYVY